MKTHILLTKLFDTGGSNSHLKILLRYLGEENVVLMLQENDQIGKVAPIIKNKIKAKFVLPIKAYAHLRYRFTTNVKELLIMLHSLITVFCWSVRYGFADVTISTVEPERYLYLLWLPFIRVTYILHSIPTKAYTPFTIVTCNKRLGKKKQIIAVSRHLFEKIISCWSIAPNKQKYVAIVHNALPDNFAPVKRTLDSSSKLILTMGRVESNKNPAIWLQVARIITARHENVCFEWVGNGVDLDIYKKLTLNEPLIKFKGFSDNPHLHLTRAYLYYQPSFLESHGIAVLEAMRYSLPCIVSNRGGLPESVKDGVNGTLVDPENVDENVNAICRLLDDNKTRDNYAENSLKLCNELFSYSYFKQKMDVLYT